ncbi:MAG: hypothetical protein KBB54_01295 [Candidatus Pacebacteria bacterium]|nr:hypothetical protein [Candidatus Paceibacterota bacterium]
MEATQTGYKQAVEDIATFLKQRSTKASELNKESDALTKKLEKEAEENKEILLFSVPFNEIVVTFGKQQMDNLFQRCEYPAGGLFLREVRFVHIETVASNQLRYFTSIRVKFLFSRECFNHDMSFQCLAFDDEHMRVSEQVVGLGTNPRFANKEKYEEVRDVLTEIATKLYAELKK